MPPRIASLLLALVVAACLIGLVLVRGPGGGTAPLPGEPGAPPHPAAAPATVVLIALDGFRGDYLNPEDTPNLWRLLPEAAWSRDLTPPFPSLTFPSHVTLATGAPVSAHGIPSNQFFDEARGEELRFPGDASLLKAEPIWTTATRQGIRTLVYDWPLSHSQGGPFAAAYFEDRFDQTLGDEDRIGRVLDLWEADPRRGPDDPPLRLVTSYAKEADTVGHREGPDSPATRDAVRRVDAVLAEAMERARRIFEANAEAGEQLHFVLAADHGMTTVTHLVNIERVLGEELAPRLQASTSGNLANLHLRAPDGADAADLWKGVEEAFAPIGGARVFSPENLPPAWSYPVEGRTGGRIVVLPLGYTFDRSSPLPVSPLPEGRGPRGMHGYPPDESPEMRGLLYLHSHPAPLAHPGDLGQVYSKQLHATLCELLGIEPSPDAEPRTVWQPLPKP
jgi:hypothetical protein